MSQPPSTPTITLTTPTPHHGHSSTLSTPVIPDTIPEGTPSEETYQYDQQYQPRYLPAYSETNTDPIAPDFRTTIDVEATPADMNDYPASPNGVALGDMVGGGVDMELVHDFGEGVGVDMRDFTHGKDEMLDHELSTPQLQQGGMSSAPPTSLATNLHGNGLLEEPAGVSVDDMFQTETGLDGDDDDDDDDDMGGASKKRVKSTDVPGGFTYVDKDGELGRRKIRIEYITDKSRRHITFSKRKAGIMKKAYELSILTGTQVLLLVVSETGLVYTFTTTKLQPLVQKSEGKNLIQACLNAPEGFGPDGQPLTGPVSATKAKNGGLAIRPHKLSAAASAAMAASAQAAAAAHPTQSSHGDSSSLNHPMSIPGPGDQQADAAAAISQGTPGSSRPKKRLPSGKKKGSAAAASAELQHAQSSMDVPPVPPIPDMHRQPSPHSMGLTLQSPIATNYYPPGPGEYHHGPGGPSPTAPNFGYNPNEYSYYPAPHHHQHHPHHQQHPHQQHHPHSQGVTPQQQQQQQSQQYLGIGGGLASPYAHTNHPAGPGHSPGGGHRDQGDRRLMGMGM